MSTDDLRRTFVLIVISGLAVALGLPTHAAEPSEGTVSRSHDVTWRGGPFEVSKFPVGCLGPDDPTCDRFHLTVDAKDGAGVLVALAGDIGGEEWYDVSVYRPDGSLAVTSGGLSSRPSVVFEHSTGHGTGPYTVLVEPTWVVDGAGTYEAVATVTKRSSFDGERDCLGLPPASVGAPGVTDAGQDVELAVTVLLDGVSRDRGRQVLASATEAYAPLDVTLVPRFRRVSLDNTEADALLAEAKALLGGVPPQHADAVHVLTTKDITLGSIDIIGLADCGGGIRYPQRAFAVSEELGALEDIPLGPFTTRVEMTSKVVAHELGHLLGATHDGANCAEGLEPDDLDGMELSPCTLMNSSAGFVSFRFSTVNAAVVRGHAVDHASP